MTDGLNSVQDQLSAFKSGLPLLEKRVHSLQCILALLQAGHDVFSEFVTLHAPIYCFLNCSKREGGHLFDLFSQLKSGGHQFIVWHNLCDKPPPDCLFCADKLSGHQNFFCAKAADFPRKSDYAVRSENPEICRRPSKTGFL
jgi:hypothetical protein